jgi:coproporphyrinogen III oxidase
MDLKQLSVSYLKSLRDTIVAEFQTLETQGNFTRTHWPYAKGQGGGEMSVLRGEVFEKAAVNWSGVSGEKFPMADGDGPFFATGVSLITHMRNPKAPTVHFNIRYIEAAGRHWFGGGFDLTPMGFPFEEDTKHFHATAREMLKPFGEDVYPKLSAWAREYFWIKHRHRERGVGGIFFDHWNSGDIDKDYAMWRAVGDNFLGAIMPIYKRRVHEPYTAADRDTQLSFRGHYVEFNLLYDRGTKFGFESGGNPEAILCSMPPLASW